MGTPSPQVFFLPYQRLPVARTSLLGKLQERPRAGLLCWQLFNRQANKTCEFLDLPSGDRMFGMVGAGQTRGALANCQTLCSARKMHAF